LMSLYPPSRCPNRASNGCSAGRRRRTPDCPRSVSPVRAPVRALARARPVERVEVARRAVPAGQFEPAVPEHGDRCRRAAWTRARPSHTGETRQVVHVERDHHRMRAPRTGAAGSAEVRRVRPPALWPLPCLATGTAAVVPHRRVVERVHTARVHVRGAGPPRRRLGKRASRPSSSTARVLVVQPDSRRARRGNATPARPGARADR